MDKQSYCTAQAGRGGCIRCHARLKDTIQQPVPEKIPVLRGEEYKHCAHRMHVLLTKGEKAVRGGEEPTGQAENNPPCAVRSRSKELRRWLGCCQATRIFGRPRPVSR